MIALHERFLAEIAEERTRLSRRVLLAGSVKVAAGATFALSLASTPGFRRLVAAQEMKTDLDVLNYALTLEHLEYAFYRDGVGLFTFGEDSRGMSIDDNFGPSVTTKARTSKHWSRSSLTWVARPSRRLHTTSVMPTTAPQDS
jgi:hypothetical protein